MSWVGGKKALRDEIVSRFPLDYKRYIEVFGGGGWVLFHKNPGRDFEVFNDFNGNLVNLYRCVREHPTELQEELRYMLLMSQKLKACGGNDLLQDSNYIIIDEAHKLIDAANSTYGVELSRGDILVLTDILKDYVAKSKQEYCRFTDLLDKLEALNKRLFKTVLAGVTMTEDRESMKLSKAKIKEAEESVEAMKIARKSMLKFQSSFETGLAVK